MIRVYQFNHQTANHNLSADVMCGTADISGLFCKDWREGTGNYQHVADVATDDRDRAYRLTNSVDGAWYEAEAEPADVRVRPRFAGMGCRSTSVGDVLVCPDGVFAVARSGWERLSLPVHTTVKLPPPGAVIVQGGVPLLSAVEFGNRLREARPSVVGVKLSDQGLVRVRCKTLMWVDTPCKPYADDVKAVLAMLASADRQLAHDDAELVA
jgi:hypothetical protein